MVLVNCKPCSIKIKITQIRDKKIIKLLDEEIIFLNLIEKIYLMEIKKRIEIGNPKPNKIIFWSGNKIGVLLSHWISGG